MQIFCTKNRMMLIMSSSLCMITRFCLFIILKSHPVANGNCCQIMRQQNHEYFDHAHNDSCYAWFYEMYNLLFVVILARLEQGLNKKCMEYWASPKCVKLIFYLCQNQNLFSKILIFKECIVPKCLFKNSISIKKQKL